MEYLDIDLYKKIMKLLVFCVCFTLFPFLNSFSQVVKLSNGISVSSLHKNGKGDINFLNDNVVNYVGSIGLNYLEKKTFYLSSELGFIRVGGKDTDFSIVNTPEDIAYIGKKFWNYIHFNTTFRLKHSFKSTTIYLGAGPKIDFLLGNKKKNIIDYEGTQLEANMKKMNIGAKLEAGIENEYKNWLLGINLSYLLPFQETGEIYYTKHNSRTFLFLALIGYRLNL